MLQNLDFNLIETVTKKPYIQPVKGKAFENILEKGEILLY